MAQGFYVATDRCYGCKTCMVTCANEKMLPPGVALRRVRRIQIEEPVGHALVSMACNHCDDPACLKNCPVGAYTKDEATGLVIQDHEMCIGCKTCIDVCPFHAPAYCEADGTTYKCDGCIDRQMLGQLPRCVETCPSQNIALGEIDEVAAMPGAVSIKDVAETGPNLFVALDPDIDVEVFADIDGLAETIDDGYHGF